MLSPALNHLERKLPGLKQVHLARAQDRDLVNPEKGLLRRDPEIRKSGISKTTRHERYIHLSHVQNNQLLSFSVVRNRCHQTLLRRGLNDLDRKSVV